MIAGMGSLMGLCPPPEEWVIASWLQPFGKVPSDLKPQDWRMLKIWADREWLTGWYRLWQEVAKGKASMPMDIAQYLLDLSDKAEEKWQTSD